MRHNSKPTDPRDVNWPSCPQCDSDETSVVPATGEWTCQDCGLQWESSETPEDDGNAADIPGEIEAMVHMLAEEDGDRLHDFAESEFDQ